MSVQRFHDAFSLDSARRRFLFKDDFLGDQVQDLWGTAGGAGGSGVVVDAETGGIVRLTTDGDTNDAWELFWSNIRSLHVNQNIIAEFKVKLNSISSVQCNIALRFDSSNRIYFFYNNTGNWRIITTDGGASEDNDSGVAADTDYHIFRIETTPTAVRFFIDDVLVGTNTTNIPDDAGDFLQPRVWLRTTENVAKSADIDYVVASQERV